MASNFKFFSQDYASAREKFVQSAGQNLVASYQNPQRGVHGEKLYTDVALYGNVNAAKTILITSATHGVEGYCGSGAQIATMRSGILDSSQNFDSNLKVVVIHAVNPYGMSHARRTNEDGVDLNRHFVDSFENLPRNPLYDDITQALVPENRSRDQLLMSGDSIQQAREQYGEEQFRALLYLGQYHHWQAPFYGGNRISWSRLIYDQILKDYAVNSEVVIQIDYHTGLGKPGSGQMVGVLNAENERAAVAAWGDLYVPVGDKQTVAYELMGSIQSYTEKMCRGIVIAAGFEFGTVEEGEMNEAVCQDQWLNCYGDLDSPQAVKIKQRMLQAFYIYEPWWCECIVEQGLSATQLSLDYLSG